MIPIHDQLCLNVVIKIDLVQQIGMVDPAWIATRRLGIALDLTARMEIDLGQAPATAIKPIVIVQDVDPMRMMAQAQTALAVTPIALTSTGVIERAAILSSENDWMKLAAEGRSMTMQFAIAWHESKIVTAMGIVIATATGVIVVGTETEMVTEMAAEVTGTKTVTGMADGTIATGATCQTTGIAMLTMFVATSMTGFAMVGMIAGTPITDILVIGTSTLIVPDQATGGRGLPPIV
ncbi:hypothetical protein [Bremerella alba]|uniref:Uncharacterized protein n=1 Tax=Bremerella alba TaxID=980252 RepID=A0A7V8V9N9_9BACT|nr:hypothetical protein [Bremerella alba]MBA2117498.1 hypothetical protein [Bremerella alba]